MFEGNGYLWAYMNTLLFEDNAWLP